LVSSGAGEMMRKVDKLALQFEKGKTSCT